MDGNNIDLRRLPIKYQYLIGLFVVAIIAAVAWITGRNKPTPLWIKQYLIPILGWAYLVLFCYAIVYKLIKKKKARRTQEKDGGSK